MRRMYGSLVETSLPDLPETPKTPGMGLEEVTIIFSSDCYFSAMVV